MNRIAMALFRTWCAPIAAWLAAATASAQDFAIDPIHFASFTGTSTDGNFAVSGALTKADGRSFGGGTFAVTGGFVSLIPAGPPPVKPATIFDNSGGSDNGISIADTTTTLANKFCLGPQAYLLDSVTLLLNTRDPGNPPVVRLQIYSDDPATGKPSASTGIVMNLSGASNPITFKFVASSYQAPFTWTNATPFLLAANRCYWVVFSVDRGEVLCQVSASRPTGAAAVFGRSQSKDGGVTWEASDNEANRKMVIRGTAGPAPPALVVTAVILSGDELRFSFPGNFGQSYVIESRTEMAAGEWVFVPGSTKAGTGASLEVSLPLPASQPQQFYRVRQLP